MVCAMICHPRIWTPMMLMDIHGYPWTSIDLDTNGHLWTFMDFYGPPWRPTEIGQIPLRLVNNCHGMASPPSFFIPFLLLPLAPSFQSSLTPSDSICLSSGSFHTNSEIHSCNHAMSIVGLAPD